MLDPELTNLFILACQGIAIIRHGVAEKRSVEIKADVVRLRPIHPSLKVFRFDLVSVDELGAELAVARMEADPMRTGNDRKHLFKIGSELLDRLRFAGIGAGDLKSTAAELGIGSFKPADIIALPAMNRDRNPIKPLEDCIGINADRSVPFFRVLI